MKKQYIFLIATIFSLQSFAVEFRVTDKKVGASSIPFVQNASGNEGFYTLKADYAQVQKMAPLQASQLASLKAEDLRNLSMEEFNQLYARIGSGPMPLGDYAGFVLQKPPVLNAIRARLLKQIKGSTEFASFAKTICMRDVDDCLLEFIWKGKRFYKKDDMDQIETKTTINFVSAGLKQIPAFLSKYAMVDRAVDFSEGLIDKASVTAFPMHVFCGISQVDTRRESIIVDAAYGDDFSDYIAIRDEAVTRKGLNITEEYRMVRPGLYIGKIYSNKLFLFNIALQKTGLTISQETKNECADGSKTR